MLPLPQMRPSEAERQFRLDPTAEDIKTAWASIRIHESAVESVEDRIRDLSAQIRDLRYDQAKHRAAIARCMGIITLARRLPQELLIKIFMHCIDDGWTRAPVVVSQVCSAWRRAAHSPKVWSHLYVRCDDADVLDRTRFWLTMAQNVDLCITVAASWRVPWETVDDVMALLVKYSAQLETLKLKTDFLMHTFVILAHCQLPMAELRQVDIDTKALDIGDPDSESDITRLTAFSVQNAPRLTTISYISSVIPAPIFPEHLTSLTIEVKESPVRRPLSAALILACIEHLSELRSLTLSMPLIYEAPFVPEHDPSRVIPLSALTILTLYGPTDLNGLLSHLDTPALRLLHLRSLEELDYRQQPIGPTLTQFLERCSPPLDTLELHDLNLSPETFAHCFAMLPGLRELRLHEAAITDATVRLLQGPRGLCPRLARLVLRWCGLLNGRALVDFVRSRSRGGASGEPVEEVAVINCCYVLEEDVLDLARMTTCRIVKNPSDYCRDATCCQNGRYRTRLHFKQASVLRDCQAAGMHLVV